MSDDNPFGLDLTVFHAYEFEIVPVPLAQIPPGYPIWKASIDNSYNNYAVALYARSAFEAAIILLDKGCTPVKLLNPKEHD
jgi:hypothetical protein